MVDKTANRITRIAVVIALVAALLTTGTVAASAQQADQPVCGSTFDQLIFKDLPPAKRIIIRRGTEATSTWVTTIDGSSTEWTKPAQPFSRDWRVIVVPTDRTPRFTLTCLQTLPIQELPFTGPACISEINGVNDDRRNQLSFFGLTDTRPQLRSVQSGWIARVAGATEATVSTRFVSISPIQFTETTRFEPNDDYFVRVRANGEVSDIACQERPATINGPFFVSPELAPPIPDDVAVEQSNFFVRTDGELVVEIVNTTTGLLTVLDVSDDFKNPRISPNGRVLWMLDQETQLEMRIDLDSRIVTRRPR